MCCLRAHRIHLVCSGLLRSQQAPICSQRRRTPSGAQRTRCNFTPLHCAELPRRAILSHHPCHRSPACMRTVWALTAAHLFVRMCCELRPPLRPPLLPHHLRRGRRRRGCHRVDVARVCVGVCVARVCLCVCRARRVCVCAHVLRAQATSGGRFWFVHLLLRDARLIPTFDHISGRIIRVSTSVAGLLQLRTLCLIGLPVWLHRTTCVVV